MKLLEQACKAFLDADKEDYYASADADCDDSEKAQIEAKKARQICQEARTTYYYHLDRVSKERLKKKTSRD